jgi:hypothetical protein
LGALRVSSQTIENHLIAKTVLLLANGHEKQVNLSHFVVLHVISSLTEKIIKRATKDQRELLMSGCGDAFVELYKLKLYRPGRLSVKSKLRLKALREYLFG